METHGYFALLCCIPAAALERFSLTVLCCCCLPQLARLPLFLSLLTDVYVVLFAGLCCLCRRSLMLTSFLNTVCTHSWSSRNGPSCRNVQGVSGRSNAGVEQGRSKQADFLSCLWHIIVMRLIYNIDMWLVIEALAVPTSEVLLWHRSRFRQALQNQGTKIDNAL